MKVHGILFKPSMALAAREGRKTMTSRIMSLDLAYTLDPGRGPEDAAAGYPLAEDEYGEPRPATDFAKYQPGDLLYVKEAHRLVDFSFINKWTSCVEYKDGTRGGYTNNCDENSTAGWRSPLLMPKWAARDWYEVTSIKAYQIADISDEECLREGIEPFERQIWDQDQDGEFTGGHSYELECREPFRDLWNSIHAEPKPVVKKGKTVSYVSYPFEGQPETRGHRGLPWKVRPNPWVWGIGFKKIERPKL